MALYVIEEASAPTQPELKKHHDDLMMRGATCEHGPVNADGLQH